MDNEIIYRVTSYLCIVLCLVILSTMIYFLRKKIDSKATLWVNITLHFWFFLMIKEFAYFFGDKWHDAEITNVMMSIDVWIIPLIAISLLEVVQPKWINLSRAANMLFPFFIFTILNVIISGNATLHAMTQIFSFAFATLFGAITLTLSYKYEKYIREHYSSIEYLGVKWIRIMIIQLYVLATVWFFTSFNLSWLNDTLYYLYVTACISTISLFTLRHKSVFIPNYMSIKSILNIDSKTDTHNENQHTIDKRCIDIANKLEIAMNRDKLFLNPELKLIDLAAHIGTNRTYLSNYINEYKSVPFINYINSYRIDEAISIIKSSSEEITVSEVSERSGFSSVSTFRRVFKQIHNCSPSEYLNKQADLT